jgi:hypothetical protein
MTDTVQLSDLKHSDPRRSDLQRSASWIRRKSEQERLHRALSEVTPDNHPRTARLLASSPRKTAQTGIEEAEDVALAAVPSPISKPLPPAARGNAIMFFPPCGRGSGRGVTTKTGATITRRRENERRPLVKRICGSLLQPN